MTDKSNSRWQAIDRLFAATLERPENERNAFLEDACGDDVELLADVRSLLQADARTELPLQSAVRRAAGELTMAPADTMLQKRIGNYQLVDLLGAGGMGNVYLGRRIDQQFEHEVAIKVLPLANANRAFIERFRAERQVLAGLDHPNIARLLDGGETDDGIPYLVMEYVHGVPIDEYCDQRKLSIPERLQLFLSICSAVDYAHRNLVVHRDVKPSNILVTDNGTPKLLDFGIAKVIDPAAGLAGLTQDGQHPMTPEYASPEQVRGEQVSTATDIYSLGVLLYRLLCGQAPYQGRGDLPLSLAQAILEHQPSRPSTAVTGADDDGRATDLVAASRRSTLARLRRRLQGDLDNITLMALRKEPERRYPSASAMRLDIENYLADRPIAARADSAGYRVGKFVRRNRVAVAAASVVAVVLVAAALQVIAQRDRAETEAETAQRVSDFLVRMLQSSDPYQQQGDVTARELLDSGTRQIDVELADEPLVGARLRTTMAKAHSSLGSQDTAAVLAASALGDLHKLPNTFRDRATTLTTLAYIEIEPQNYGDALQHAQRAAELLGSGQPDSAAQVADARIAMSRALLGLDESARAQQAAENAVALLRSEFDDQDPRTNDAVSNLSAIHNELGNYDIARQLAEKVVAWNEQNYGMDDLLVARPLHNLGRITWHQGDYRSAHDIYIRELAILERSLGENHPALHAVLVSLASNERKLGYPSNAKAYYERAIQVLEDADSPALGKLANTYGSLGTLLMDNGFLDEAEPLIRRGLELSELQFGKGSAESTFRLLHLGILFRKRGDYVQGRHYLSQAVDAALSRYPDSHRDVQIMRLHLAVNELQSGDSATARKLLAGVLDSLQAHQGPDHPLVGQTLIELAGVDIEDREFAAADLKLVRAMEIYRALRDDVHPDIELILRWRAIAHEGMERADSAARFVTAADSLRDRRQKVSAEEAQAAQDKVL